MAVVAGSLDVDLGVGSGAGSCVDSGVASDGDSTAELLGAGASGMTCCVVLVGVAGVDSAGEPAADVSGCGVVLVGAAVKGAIEESGADVSGVDVGAADVPVAVAPSPVASPLSSFMAWVSL